MKFVVAVVMLALAFGTESSVIPWGAPLSYTAVSGPAVAYVPAPAASVAVHARNLAAAPATVVAAQVAPVWGPAPAAVSIAAAPAVYAGGPAVYAAGPAVVAAPAAVVAAPAHEGSYIAKTRGAVHVAPLAGHANSAASINLQPAPGTV